MWTFSEADVLIPNIRYLLTQVDEVMVSDRGSDPEILAALRKLSVTLDTDGDRFGYDQSQVMTDMARQAAERGHEWVVPVDPDEVWYANAGPLKVVLGGMSKDVGAVRAELYNHVATGADAALEDPFKRMRWRQKYPLPLHKVAARTRPDLVIETGNHRAHTDGVCLTIGPALVIRHFPYRTEDQFVERVRTAYAALLSADLPESSGSHIRAYGRCLYDEGEEVLREHFRQWFYSPEPGNDDSLMYDPAPI